MQTTLAMSRTGKWEVRYSERQPDGTYRSKSVSTRETDRGAAESFRQIFEAQLSQAVIAAKGVTFGECVDEYLRRPKFATRQSTDISYASYARLKKDFGVLAVTDLNAKVIGDFLKTKKWATGTSRRMVIQMKTVLTHAQRMKLIKADDIPHLEAPPPSPPRDKWLTEAEEADFHAKAMGHSFGEPRLTRVTRFIAIALDTGQRRMAILTLKWDQVDFKKGVIDFRMKGATSKKQSVVPISKRLLPTLERAYAERVSGYVLDSVVTNFEAFETFCRNAGYPWVTPHVLRHTTATLLLRAGVDIWEVAGVLGNSAAMVERVYGHHAPDHLRSAVDKRFSGP